MYVPSARSCTCNPASELTRMLDAPNVSTFGWIWIDTNCWSRPQLDTVSSTPATTIRAMTLNHFPFMQDSRASSGLEPTTTLERANVVNGGAKSNSPRGPWVQLFTASATHSANSLTSSSVVSNEHIQRTMPSSSIHG